MNGSVMIRAAISASQYWTQIPIKKQFCVALCTWRDMILWPMTLSLSEFLGLTRQKLRDKPSELFVQLPPAPQLTRVGTENDDVIWTSFRALPISNVVRDHCDNMTDEPWCGWVIRGAYFTIGSL